MSGEMLTKMEFVQFSETLNKSLERLEHKIDALVDPKSGVYVDIAKVQAMAKRAHERMDETQATVTAHSKTLYGQNGTPGVADRVREIEKVLAKVSRASWYIAIPILGGLGTLIARSFGLF